MTKYRATFEGALLVTRLAQQIDTERMRNDYHFNHIYNKILDRDRFSVHLFAT